MSRHFDPPDILPPKGAGYGHGGALESGPRWPGVAGQAGIDVEGELLDGVEVEAMAAASPVEV